MANGVLKNTASYNKNLELIGSYLKFIGIKNLNSTTSMSFAQSPDSVYLVVAGTWNFSVVYLVFPNNNSTPVTREIAKYGNSPQIAFSAYGQWGVTITGTSSTWQPTMVFAFNKS